jgi:hypothetical protein
MYFEGRSLPLFYSNIVSCYFILFDIALIFHSLCSILSFFNWFIIISL